MLVSNRLYTFACCITGCLWMLFCLFSRTDRMNNLKFENNEKNTCVNWCLGRAPLEAGKVGLEPLKINTSANLLAVRHA